MVAGQLIKLVHEILDEADIKYMLNLRVGIERCVLGGHGNFKSAQEQSMLIGALEYNLSEAGYVPKIIMPASAKRALTGNGKASKEKVVDTARSIIDRWPDFGPLKKNWKEEEAVADAAAVAMITASHTVFGEEDAHAMDENTERRRKNAVRRGIEAPRNPRDAEALDRERSESVDDDEGQPSS